MNGCEDIERLGWRAWLEAQDDVLAEREHLLEQHNQHRAEQLVASRNSSASGEQALPHPDAWHMLRDGILAWQGTRATHGLPQCLCHDAPFGAV